jgi:hypothetical protein
MSREAILLRAIVIIVESVTSRLRSLRTGIDERVFIGRLALGTFAMSEAWILAHLAALAARAFLQAPSLQPTKGLATLELACAVQDRA